MRRAGLSAFFVLLLVGACGGSDDPKRQFPEEQSEGAARHRTAGFETVTPCPFPAAQAVDPGRLTCGYLTVPENRKTPASASLKVPVAILRTVSATPEPDPVVFLHGGPGGGALSSPRVFELFSSHMFGQHRDFILLDQRGSLLTEPALTCGELPAERLEAFAKDVSLEARDALIAGAARACLALLAQSGRDLHGYGAADIAADLRDLREALGIRQWNLMGVSYGTFIALETARADEAGIRSMILDSVVSPQSDLFMSEGSRNFAQGLGRVLEACEKDVSCSVAFPDLETRLQRLLQRLEGEPARIRVSGLPGEEAADLTVNWHDFLSLVHWMLYNETMIRLVPLLISETEAGNLLALTYLSDNVFPAPKNAAESAMGAFLATVCEDQFRSGGRAPVAPGFTGFSITSFMQEVCAAPDFGYLGARTYGPVPTSVPTLVLSGYFDPMTPDIYARQILADLDRAEFVSVPNFGHSTLSGYTACQTSLANDFLDTLSRTEAFTCVDDLSPPAFILSLPEAISLLTPG